MFKNIVPWIILALVIRIAVMSFSLHPDLRAYAFGSYLISQKGMVFNFYDYLGNLPAKDPLVGLYGVDFFIYPPLAYLSFAPFMAIFSSLYPWDLFQTFLSDMGQVYGHQQLPFMLFLLKVPFLVFDLIGLWLIRKLLQEHKKKFWASFLWLFNPITMYSSYMMGQSDLLVALFVLLAIVMFSRKKYLWAAVSLGVGGGVKLFPLLLIPFLVLQGGRTISERLKILIVAIGAYLAVILPYLPSVGFRRYALVASQTDKMLFAKIPVSGAEYLPIFLVIFVFLVWLCWANSNCLKLWQWFLLILLTFFSLTHYHPQWFVWLVPLLILLVVSDVTRKLVIPVVVLLFCYMIIVFMFDSSLNFGLFSVINPSLNSISFNSFVARFYETNIFSSIIRGIFASTALFISLRLFLDKGNSSFR